MREQALVEVISAKAGLIAEDAAPLGEKIRLAMGKEFQDLACAFNTMPENLRHQRNHQEERGRTAPGILDPD